MKYIFLLFISSIILWSCSDSSTNNQTNAPDWYKLEGTWIVSYDEENYDDANGNYSMVPTTIEMTITKTDVMSLKLNYRNEIIEGIVSKSGKEWIVTKSVPPSTTYTMSFITISDNEWTGSITMMINTADYKYNGGDMKGTRKN